MFSHNFIGSVSDRRILWCRWATACGCRPLWWRDGQAWPGPVTRPSVESCHQWSDRRPHRRRRQKGRAYGAPMGKWRGNPCGSPESLWFPRFSRAITCLNQGFRCGVHFGHVKCQSEPLGRPIAVAKMAEPPQSVTGNRQGAQSCVPCQPESSRTCQ